ncbi:MAG TPA: succinate dehydrogenase, cytochrome b556 subunit [Rubrivivax sp.]|nr:succinate dehydrogenase, cytochrome b556 subunit [Rubrivivax sp.]HRZ62448.1 succinate dehydrogenase, cytochrome b556 subunit [Rubrivivax sp.]
MAETAKPRPVYRNIHISQIVTYRLPPAGIVSILHRASGALMFLLLPFVIWLFDNSISSEISFDRFRSAFLAGIGFVPGWFVRLVCLGLIWAYLHHLFAGLRFLWMDVTLRMSKEQGRSSALLVLATSLLLTAALGAKLFGLY